MEIEKRLSELEEKNSALIKLVLTLNENVIEGFKSVDRNFEIINNKIDDLSSNSNKQFRKVGGKLDEIHTELEKIQKVSKYYQEYENLLKLVK